MEVREVREEVHTTESGASDLTQYSTAGLNRLRRFLREQFDFGNPRYGVEAELLREVEAELIERDLCAWCTGKRAQFSALRLRRMGHYLASQESPTSAQLCVEIETEILRRKA